MTCPYRMRGYVLCVNILISSSLHIEDSCLVWQNVKVQVSVALCACFFRANNPCDAVDSVLKLPKLEEQES